MRPPDACFADPRLAVLYDDLDGSRDDLDAYVAIADEVGARTVVDVGVDPAMASLEVAKLKPGADEVTWLHGDATVLDALDIDADLAVMTGNVAQVFVDDADWRRTLSSVHGALRPGGVLAFETRRVEARAWESWDCPPTEVEVAGGTVTVECTVTVVALPLVTFAGVSTVAGERIPSTSTLRFRDLDELETDLTNAGFEIVDVREAPDRPGLEHVVLTRAR